MSFELELRQFRAVITGATIRPAIRSTCSRSSATLRGWNQAKPKGGRMQRVGIQARATAATVIERVCGRLLNLFTGIAADLAQNPPASDKPGLKQSARGRASLPD
jgi:hypothetical protein